MKKEDEQISQSQPTFKSCQNCKFYTADKNRCNHRYWYLCIERDNKGYVTRYWNHVSK